MIRLEALPDFPPSKWDGADSEKVWEVTVGSSCFVLQVHTNSPLSPQSLKESMQYTQHTREGSVPLLGILTDYVLILLSVLKDTLSSPQKERTVGRPVGQSYPLHLLLPGRV